MEEEKVKAAHGGGLVLVARLGAGIEEGGYPLNSGNRHGDGLVGRTPKVRAGRPRPAAGSGARGLRAGVGARPTLPCRRCDYLSQADTHLEEIAMWNENQSSGRRHGRPEPTA